MEENSGVSAKSLHKDLNGFTVPFLMKALTLPTGALDLTRLSRRNGALIGGWHRHASQLSLPSCTSHLYLQQRFISLILISDYLHICLLLDKATSK